MKSLVIGGTRGFGKELSDQLLDRGYNLITVSRSASEYENHPHYSCDVGDLDSWHKTLQRIQEERDSLDFLACVAGFTRAKSSKNLTADDWNQTLSRNITYVALALQELSDLLRASNNPKALTIGSQWSYEIGCDELVPYTVSKHALRTLTEDFAQRNPRIQINHYCVPTMDTPGYWEVKKSFRDIGEESTIMSFYKRRILNFSAPFSRSDHAALSSFQSSGRRQRFNGYAHLRFATPKSASPTSLNRISDIWLLFFLHSITPFCSW